MSALRYLFGRPGGAGAWRRFALHVLGIVTVLSLLAGYGALRYNPDWAKRSHLTASLGAAQLVPEQLQKFYNQQSKVYDVISAIAGIQAQLQQQIGPTSASPDGLQHHVHLRHAPGQHLSAGRSSTRRTST